MQNFPGGKVNEPFGFHMYMNCLKNEIYFLTLKAPITTAADDKFCDIFPNFRQK